MVDRGVKHTGVLNHFVDTIIFADWTRCHLVQLNDPLEDVITSLNVFVFPKSLNFLLFWNKKCLIETKSSICSL